MCVSADMHAHKQIYYIRFSPQNISAITYEN
jgi:hypothetical protein